MIRTTLTFQANERGGDPVAFVEHVPVFPGQGHKGLIKPGESWECDVLFASPSVVMIGPKRKVDAVAPEQLGRLIESANGVDRVIELADACRIMRAVRRPPIHALQAERKPPAPPPPAAKQPVAAASSPRAWLESDVGKSVIRGIVMQLGLQERINEALEEVRDEIQSVLDGNLIQVRQQMKDLTSQVENFRRAALEWERSRASDLRGVPKPTPKDPERPTDEEVERELIHQLYRADAWGAKYKPLDNIRGGFNARVPEAQVTRAVKSLEGKGWIAHYAKSEDMYRLNPRRARDIYRFLGAADRALDALVTQAEEAGDEGASRLTRKDLDKALGDYVSTQALERALSPLRSTSATRDVPVEVGSDTAAFEILRREVKTTASATAGLQGDVNRLKAAVEDLAVKVRRLTPAPPSSPEPSA